MDDFDFSEHLRAGKGLSFCRVSRQYWPHPSHYDYGRTPRPNHGILLLLHGEVLFQSETTTVRIREGEMVYLPKGSHYKASFQGKEAFTDDLLLNFTWENAPALRAPLRISQSASPTCLELFERLLRDKDDPDTSPLCKTGVFHLLLDAVCESATRRNSARRALLQRAQEMLNGEREISIAEVARVCCISESGLRKLFHDTLGISPVQYRLQARMNRAKYLLEASELNVKEIAERLHFYDEAYFCKLFRAQTGLTPRQYAAQKKL